MPEFLNSSLVPIFGIIFGVTGGIIIVLAPIYVLFRISQNRHQERLELIKSGKDLPVEMYKRYSKRTLYWGFIFSALGGGVLIMGIIDVIRNIVTDRAYAVHGGDFWGIIPLLIGIAMIVFYKFIEKENGNSGKVTAEREIKNIE